MGLLVAGGPMFAAGAVTGWLTSMGSPLPLPLPLPLSLPARIGSAADRMGMRLTVPLAKRCWSASKGLRVVNGCDTAAMYSSLLGRMIRLLDRAIL